MERRHLNARYLRHRDGSGGPWWRRPPPGPGRRAIFRSADGAMPGAGGRSAVEPPDAEVEPSSEADPGQIRQHEQACGRSVPA